MAIYPIINVKTGEKKEITCSVNDIMEWYSNNPEWKRDWSDPSTAPNNCEMGEWKDRLLKKNPGWNEVLSKASKAGGSQTQIGKI